jgi:hypothetical protein
LNRFLRPTREKKETKEQRCHHDKELNTRVVHGSESVVRFAGARAGAEASK